MQCPLLLEICDEYFHAGIGMHVYPVRDIRSGKHKRINVQRFRILNFGYADFLGQSIARRGGCGLILGMIPIIRGH